MFPSRAVHQSRVISRTRAQRDYKVSMFFAELVGDQMPPVSGEPKATESKMMEAKLKDGTIVEVTELAIGGIVTIEGVAAPVGEHMLDVCV